MKSRSFFFFKSSVCAHKTYPKKIVYSVVSLSRKSSSLVHKGSQVIGVDLARKKVLVDVKFFFVVFLYMYLHNALYH